MRFSQIGRRYHRDTVYRVHRELQLQATVRIFVNMLLRVVNRHKTIICKNVLFFLNTFSFLTRFVRLDIFDGVRLFKIVVKQDKRLRTLNTIL